jgi:hypothetical protein
VEVKLDLLSVKGLPEKSEQIFTEASSFGGRLLSEAEV